MPDAKVMTLTIAETESLDLRKLPPNTILDNAGLDPFDVLPVPASHRMHLLVHLCEWETPIGKTSTYQAITVTLTDFHVVKQHILSRFPRQ